MNRKRKFYVISNEKEDNIEKTTKISLNNYYKRMKAKDISNDILVPQNPEHETGDWT